MTTSANLLTSFRRSASGGLLLLVFAGCGTQSDGPKAADIEPAEFGPSATTPRLEAVEAAQVITQSKLRERVAHLASDELAGRGPATEGDRQTREYLSSQLEAIGLEPGFGDAWQQLFDVVSVHAKAPESWRLSAGGQSLELAWWDDYIASSGVQTQKAQVKDSELVFVGYGIEAPEYGWDDYKGVDLTGKTLLMLNNDPDWDDELFAGSRRLYYGRWTYKYEIAAAKGAAAAIIIHTTPSAGYGYQVVQSSWTGPQFQLPSEGEPRTQIEAWITEQAAARLAELAGQELEALISAARQPDFKPVPLGISHSMTLDNEVQRLQTGNVGGLLRGSDPELAEQVVVYTAHHDHLGIGKADATGDTIYNGALDNAAGVSQVLAIAEAFRALPQPPARSVLFLLVAAEEQGLLGSAYWARHPSVAPGRIAANINHDGANIWGHTRDVTLVGHGKSSLDAIVEGFAAHQGRRVEPDQFADRGFFYRSDQFNLAKIGVPAIYMDTGTDFVDRPGDWGRQQIEAWEAEHYHQPSDQLIDAWNFDGMIDDARLSFFCGDLLSRQPELPTWNPGDEFEAARRNALAEVADGR